MLVQETEKRNAFKQKMLSADVFVQKERNALSKMWKEAKSIEITLDFLSPLKYLFSKNIH